MGKSTRHDIYSIQCSEGSGGYSFIFYYRDGRMITSFSLSWSDGNYHVDMALHYLSFEQLCQLDVSEDIQILFTNGYGSQDGDRLRDIWLKRGKDDLYKAWLVQAQDRYTENQDNFAIYSIVSSDPQIIKEIIPKFNGPVFDWRQAVPDFFREKKDRFDRIDLLP